MAELITGIFKDAVPLNNEIHNSLRYRAVDGFAFASAVEDVPVVHSEWVKVSRHFPIVFHLNDAGLPDLSHALFKLIPEGRNPFLDPANHHWQNHCYIPLYLRFYPFMVKVNPSGEGHVVMVDPGAPHFSSDDGERLFDDEGNLTPFLTNIAAELKVYLEHVNQTYGVISVLHAAGLLATRRVFHQESEDKHLLAQIVSLDPANVASLASDKLGEWHQQGILPLVYAQVQSLENLDLLDRTPTDSVTDEEVVEPQDEGEIPSPDSSGTEEDIEDRSSVKPAIWRNSVLVVVLLAGAFLAGAWFGPVLQTELVSRQISIESGTPAASAQQDDPVENILEPLKELTSVQNEPENRAVVDVIELVNEEAENVDGLSVVTILPSQQDLNSPQQEAIDNNAKVPEAIIEAVVTVAEDLPGAESDADPEAEVETEAETEAETETEEADNKAEKTAEPESAPILVPQITPLSPVIQRQIDNLLAGIETNIQQSRLSRPANDNALQKAAQIKELDPDGETAQQAMSSIVDRYIQLARRVGGPTGKRYLIAAHGLNSDLSKVESAWQELYAGDRPPWQVE